MFIALALVLPAFAMADEVSSWDMRDGGEMDISEHHQCYVYGQCQELSVDFSYQEDAEGCHSFCGKLDGCNWWSWEPEQSLCMAFDDCTASGGPDSHICPDCISGEKLCPARECHQQFKCKGNFVDSFTMSKLEKCIIACNSNDQCNWYTLEKMHDHCILYEDCDLHDDHCDTCATGPKLCSHGYHADDDTIFTQALLDEFADAPVCATNNYNVGPTLCGGHWASDCAHCVCHPNGVTDVGAPWCNGVCQYVNGECIDRR